MFFSCKVLTGVGTGCTKSLEMKSRVRRVIGQKRRQQVSVLSSFLNAEETWEMFLTPSL